MARYFKFPEELKDYDFVALYDKESNARLKIKYLALSYLKEGKPLMEVSNLIYVGYSTIATWVFKLQTNGLTGLQNKARSGRTKKLSKDNLPAFKKDVLELQEQRIGGRVIAKDIQKHLAEKYGCDCCLATVYNLLAEVNLVWITGRSSHPKRDEAAQSEFKKTLNR